MKKILTLTLLTLSIIGFSQTLEVERNLKINENLITTGENLLPDRVITLDTTNDKVTETNVTKVTSLSFQNVADSISKNNTFDSLNVTYNVDAKVINADSVDCEVFETDEVIILNSTSETTPASATGIGVENSNATANRVNCIGFGASSVFQSGMLNTWVDANTNNLSLYNWTGGAISEKIRIEGDSTKVFGTFQLNDSTVTSIVTGDTVMTKEYADTAYTGTTYYINNGLTKDSDTIKLGGEFDEDITIYSTPNGKKVYIQVFDVDYYEGSLYIDTNRILLYKGDDDYESYIEVNDSSTIIGAQSGTDNAQINILPTEINVNIDADSIFKCTKDTTYITNILKLGSSCSVIKDSSGNLHAETDTFKIVGNAYVSGKIGINTVTPSEKLHVNGNALINDNLDVEDSSFFNIAKITGNIYFNPQIDSTAEVTKDTIDIDFDYNVQFFKLKCDTIVLDIANLKSGHVQSNYVYLLYDTLTVVQLLDSTEFNYMNGTFNSDSAVTDFINVVTNPFTDKVILNVTQINEY